MTKAKPRVVWVVEVRSGVPRSWGPTYCCVEGKWQWRAFDRRRDALALRHYFGGRLYRVAKYVRSER